jgi:hypothetical protein
MARPTKQGIDYFPLDTDFDDDLQLFVTEVGAEGLGILITIWQAIYKGEGYYIAFDKKFPLKIKQKCFSSVETIVNVVENAIDYGIFDVDLYKKYQILTSNGVQKRFFPAARLKKQVKIIPKYILVDVSTIENGVNAVGNGVNVVGNATNVNVDIKEDIADLKKSATNEFYITKSGKKLTGKRLETFEKFWNFFNYKKGKSAAADSWYKIESLTNSIVDKIYLAAQIESKNRKALIEKGSTPKWAQGWITERRWEDEDLYSEQTKKKVIVFEVDENDR